MHSQEHHETLEDQDVEIDTAIVTEASVLIRRDSPSPDQVVTEHLESYKADQSYVRECKLLESAHVVQVTFVDGEVYARLLIVLLGCNLPSKLLRVLTGVPHFDREGSFLDEANVIFFFNTLLTPTILILITSFLVRVRRYLIDINLVWLVII